MSFQTIENLIVENLGNKSHILMILYYSAVIYSNSAALLTSVLQSKKSVVTGICGTYRAVAVNSEYAAFFVKLFIKKAVRHTSQCQLTSRQFIIYLLSIMQDLFSSLLRHKPLLLRPYLCGNDPCQAFPECLRPRNGRYQVKSHLQGLYPLYSVRTQA